MHCGRVSNLLSAYLDRELAGAEMLQIRQHLESCPGCSTEVEALGRVKSLLALSPPNVPPEDPVAAVMHRWALRREPSARPVRRWSWSWKWLSVPPRWQRYSLAFTCACLALALAGTALALRKPNYPDAVAANVLPTWEIQQSYETLPAPGPMLWPLERWPRRSAWPRSEPRVLWSEPRWRDPGGAVTGMLVSESHYLPYGSGR